MNKPLPENFLAHELAKIADGFNPQKAYERDCIKAVVEVDDCPNFSRLGCDRDGPCICDRIAKAVLAVRRP